MTQMAWGNVLSWSSFKLGILLGVGIGIIIGNIIDTDVFSSAITKCSTQLKTGGDAFSTPSYLDIARLQIMNEPSVSLARKSQCLGASVPMPCPLPGHRVHHLHIGKTGGRSVIRNLPEVVGMPMCDWPEFPWTKALYQNISGFDAVAALRSGPSDEVCITSYKSTWTTIDAFQTPPIVVTFLREPITWACSAIMHFVHNRPTEGCDFDSVIDEHRDGQCFEEPEANHLRPNQKVTSCRPSNSTERHQPVYPLPNFIIGQLDPGVPDGSLFGHHVRPTFAAARLESTVFGLIEYVPASYCLMKFQFGLANTTEWQQNCKCSNRKKDESKRVGTNNYKKSTARLENISTLAKGMADYQKVYSHALEVFLGRVDHVYQETGVKLIC